MFINVSLGNPVLPLNAGEKPTTGGFAPNALKYEKGTDSAPILVSKGQDMVARRIKTIAIEYEVPMVENKLVARTLYALCRVGEKIPFELYQVVAKILADVYQSHSYYFHRLKARRLLSKKPSQ